MDKKKCLQLLLYSLCVSASLAVDIFNPALKGLFCTHLLDGITPKPAGLDIDLSTPKVPPKSTEERVSSAPINWGDYPLDRSNHYC
jgi:hypothetical protein